MGVDLTPLILLTVLPGTIGTVLLAFGIDRRARRSRRLVLLVVGSVLVAFSVSVLVLWEVETNTVRFSYRVTLTPTGSGTVRVSLPTPADEALMASLSLSTGSSSVALNRSGDEPALDVTLVEPTTLTASFSSYRYSGPYDLTRAEDWGQCGQGCNATVFVLVLSGDATAVQVEAHASWSKFSSSPFWDLEVLALPGEWEYSASWGMMVC